MCTWSSSCYTLSLRLSLCFKEACLTGGLWLMTTQGLMKACKSNGSISTWHSRSQDRVAAFKLKNMKLRPSRTHIPLMFDLQLLISHFQLIFVKLCVVLAVCYATIITSKARQTLLALLCWAELNNNPDKNRELVLCLLDKVYLSYFSFVPTRLFAHYRI